MFKTNNRSTAAVICLVFLMSACSTVNPYTGEKQTSKLAIGAGVGAAGGALIGLITADSKDRQRNALIGAGIGALAGGSIGYYMDVQEAKLRQRLSDSGVNVTRSGNQIILNMPGNVTFSTGSPDIDAGFYNVLNSVAIVLNEYKKTTVDVIGHTDNVGDASYNQTLSEHRARSVAEYLAGQKVLDERLLIAGRGESQPIAANTTPEGRARNRRVTIQITPLAE
ncbi:MAG: OmpA family protein [Desulfatitalea sp.]|nr:OmpA family protein [Desulfatitalea sp.]NNJ99896.1 OmpA family protein [Desulfatitalea sp.]